VPQSLQGGKAALQCPEFSMSHTPGCVLSDWPALDTERMAKLLATLSVRPTGMKITQSGTAEVLGVNYKTLSRDLHALIHGMRLPVTRSRRCVWLAAPIQLCTHCELIGRQFTQTEHFLINFKVALPIAGLTSMRRLSRGGMGSAADPSPE
jgi:hypothetical protein